jgi:hypothetical protein
MPSYRFQLTVWTIPSPRQPGQVIITLVVCLWLCISVYTFRLCRVTTNTPARSKQFVYSSSSAASVPAIDPNIWKARRKSRQAPPRCSASNVRDDRMPASVVWQLLLKLGPGR